MQVVNDMHQQITRKCIRYVYNLIFAVHVKYIKSQRMVKILYLLYRRVIRLCTRNVQCCVPYIMDNVPVLIAV